VLEIRTGGLLRVLGDSWRAVRRMRSLGIDTTIDLEFFARSSAILGFLSGARNRVGLHVWGGWGGEGPWRPWRGDLMTHRVRYNVHLHTSQMFRVLVDALDVEPRKLPMLPWPAPGADEPLMRFEAGDDEINALRRKLLNLAPFLTFPQSGATEGGNGRLILLNPNCSDLLPLRAWPRERYVELARRLLERFDDVYVAFTGSPGEAAAAQQLVDSVESDRCINLAGRTTMRELLVLYTLADVLVTNDSGPAHFAALTDIDVVVLFGPETPALFGARTQRTHMLYRELACSPCVSALNNRTSACTDNQCMKQISVDRVLEAVCSVLKQRSGSRQGGGESIDLPLVHVLPGATGAMVESRSLRTLTSQ
jgi:ADP-heptose:LPS heptosyltransferase